MKNLLTIVALMVSLSGIAASLLREEMRCYLGLPSQSCQTAEKPSLPVSLPEMTKNKELKPVKPVILPKSSQSFPQEPILSSEDVPSQPQPISETNPSTETALKEDLQIPVESAAIIESESEKIPESEPEYNYAEDAIPIPIEPYDPSK